MKTFQVQVWEEQGAYLTIKAKTQKEADKIAEKEMGWGGITFNLDEYTTGKVVRVDVTHRMTERL